MPTYGSMGLAKHAKDWPCGHSTVDGCTIVTVDGSDAECEAHAEVRNYYE